MYIYCLCVFILKAIQDNRYYNHNKTSKVIFSWIIITSEKKQGYHIWRQKYS